MFRSQPIPMVQNGQQLSVVKLAICYVYTVAAEHYDIPVLGAAQALRLKIYGIDKTGESLLAICPLETSGSYAANTYAATVITGIPVKDYNAICFTYDIKETLKVVSDFSRIVGSPKMFVEVKVLPDILESTSYTNVTGA